MTTSDDGRPLRTAIVGVVNLRLAEAANPGRVAAGCASWSEELDRLLAGWDFMGNMPAPNDVRLIVDKLYRRVAALPDAQARARELDRYLNGSGTFW